ncbi:UNVERIFIED_CONTAM: hypothetical protein FKN15_033996 [Acipenser sinensis]
MHHGSGAQNVQRQLQRSKSFTGTEAEEQQQQPTNLPQSPVTSFAPSASPSAPQSPNYQIIMSRSPVPGQNVNITLQNVGQMVGGNQQITLTPLPLQNPASPGFQHSAQQWRFEHSSPSYIQVTSPLPQQVQPQSPTPHSPVPVQALQGVQRAGAPATGLSMCGQSPTRGFVDASMLVRQISLSSPSSSGHFVYQDGSGLAQLASGSAGQVQLSSPGTPGSVRERRLSQPHSQTGGTIHHLGPQSPAASGASIQTLGSPGHITTSSLPPQISSIIQGQLIQQQVLHGQQLCRAIGFDRTPPGMLSGVGGSAAPFGMASPLPPSSPSRANAPQGLSNPPLTPTSASASVKKQPKKLEIPPATPEIAQLRKQCLEQHRKATESLKDSFKEHLIELFFLQHLQGNMMDFLAFKKKPCGPLFMYLRQNDLDLEDDEEEEQSEVINDEVKMVTGKDGQAGTPVAIATQLPPNVSAAFSSPQQQFQQTHQGTPVAGTANSVEIEAFKRQQALAQADQARRPRIEVGRHGMVFQHPGIAPLGSPGVPLQQLMPTVQGGMPPTPQNIQMAGQKQSQQQYDPSKGPPVQNAASLHTPPPQLPSRLQPTSMPLNALPPGLQLAQQQLVEAQAQPQTPLQVQVKQQLGPASIANTPQTQLQAQLQQQMQPGLHVQMQTAQQLPQSQAQLQQVQATVALVRPGADSSPACQRLVVNSIPTSSLSPAPLVGTVSPSTTYSTLRHRTSPGSSKPLSPISQSKLTVSSIPKMSSLVQGGAQDGSQDKQAEQAKLENQVHQRIAELRKEGLWSMSRLPKLQDAPRPKSHWDYLLEEMQWMAADFSQERRWKVAAAKKLVRTCARYHDEQRQIEEREKTEEEARLRCIACTIAKEVEYFWANIEQVVEVKLQIEVHEKRRKALSLRRAPKEENTVVYYQVVEVKLQIEVHEKRRKALSLRRAPKGKDAKPIQETGVKSEKESSLEFSPAGRKRKASTSTVQEEVEDEESTLEEQEAVEGAADHKNELAELDKEAKMSLDSLVEQYAGAYAENFEWPHPSSHSEDDDRDEEVEESPLESYNEEILIDSLLSIEEHRGPESSKAPLTDGQKPRKDIAEVAAAAELLLPKGSARATAVFQNAAPFLLHGSLRKYQQIGVDWLASLYKKHLNGILADETGLGKTVQTAAFLAHLACKEGNWGPHLVVVRTCKILSWEMEIKRWCPSLKILVYLGNKKERRLKRRMWSESNGFHVCLTSYKLLLKDHKDFLRKRWKYLVMDEIQLLKNMTEKHWETILTLKSQQRLLLINTPLQNTLKELWTMIHFLLPGITRQYLDFPVKAGTDENQEYCHKLVIRLHRVIQPFILRRSKRDVEKQLPKKYEHILKCRLSSRQKILYEDVMTQTRAQEALKTGHFVSVLHVLMQLQRICNHPDLVHPRTTRSAYVSAALQYTTPSLVLAALQYDPWKNVDMSIFDLIGNENKLTRYEAEEALPKQKVTRKLIEEIYSAPDPPARPKQVKLKSSRLFEPVQYGQKPEGRTVAFPGSPPQRTPTTTTTAAATVSQQGQVIQPFILRRSKRDVEKQLPKKYEHILKCRLSSRQKILYEDVMTQTRAQEALKTGHFVGVLHVLMQLQRICNHPDLVHPRTTRSAYVSAALQYTTPSFVLGALQYDPWKNVDMSIFDLIGNENKLTRYEAEEALPKQKVTRKLIEEIYSAPDPPARPKQVKLKSSRLFEPVQYGQKPEGRTVAFPGSPPQRTPTTTTTAAATVSQQGQVQGKSPVSTVPATQAAGTPFQTTQTTTTTTTASSVSTPPTPGQQTVTSAASVSGGTTSSTSTVSKALSSPAGGAVPQLGQTAPVPVSRPAQITPQAPAHTMQQSVLPQRLVLTSQAQARLPSLLSHVILNHTWTKCDYPVIQPFILRRSKRDVEKQLPKKYEHILKCRLSSRQKILYEDVMTQTRAQEALKTGHFVGVLHVLMQLQRICNHPDLVHPRTTRSAYVSAALQYTTPSFVLGALQYDPWKNVDMSIFDLIGNENKLTRYEAEEVLPKQKVTRMLIEEIYSAPDPPARPKQVKLKPSRLFEPVQYGQKPEGRTVAFPGSPPQRTPTTTTTAAATVSQQGQVRGKSPVSTVPATQAAGTPFQTTQTTTTTTTASSVSTPPTPGQQTVTSAASVSGGTTSSTSTVSKALSSPAGGAVPQLGQTAPVPVSRPAQITPQAPAHTMQQSVLPQRLVLTSQAQARLPSGEVVKIAQLASITGSQSRITQPEMPVTLQFQGNKFTLSSSQLRQLTAGQPLQLQAPAVVVRTAVPSTAAGDQTANVKAVAVTGTTTQEASEARNRLVKERLDRVFSANERRCSRSVFYGADLLEVCSVFDKDPVPKPATVSNNSWRWIGRANCLSVQQASASVSHLQEALFTSEQRREALQDMAQRFVCVVPAAIAPAPQLYSANPPPQYSLALKMFRHKFHQEMAPHTKQLRSPTANHLIEFPDLRLLQMDSGKLEALSVLLHKLKSEGRRVLIFTQMVKMLDILEKFLDYHHLTYVRINEKTPAEQRQEQMRNFNRNKQIFCTILSNRCGSVVGSVLDADTVVFYDTDLNPSMDAKTQEWCDRIGRSKDIHIYRLGSGNSIEEKLLKNGTKDLIREVAAQGTDYTLAFLTQMSLDTLVEQYAGAYAENFEWPHPSSHSEDDDRDEVEESALESYNEEILIDSLLSIEEHGGPESSKAPLTDGQKPRKDIAEVAAAAELLLPKGSARATAVFRNAAPFLLHGSLREYQQIGVDWLASLYKKHLNGILADETGLGKTVQTAAFLAHLACKEGNWGPHLVVVRTCKILSWEMEIKRWCPSLKILVYLGNKKERRLKRRMWSESNGFHVCLTSYKLLLKDHEDFLRKRWKYLVLDEIQLLKNMTEKHWETILTLKSQQRLLLINTPLQNTLKELWTMIHFLLPGITRQYLDFPVKAGTDENQEYCHKLVIRLHRVIQPFILRRSKRDVEKQLPKKYEHILKCRLSSRQKILYEDVMTQTRAQEALKTGHFVSVLHVLMQLQRICNHPDLVHPRTTRSAYVSAALQYTTPSLVLGALQYDPWKNVDMSIFDLIGNENKLTRYEAEEVLPKQKVTRKLIEELYSAPDPPPRPKQVKLKPSRLFEPVQYGQKPEGRTVAFPGSPPQRTPTTTTTAAATVSQQGQVQGKSPVSTVPATQAAGTPFQTTQTTTTTTTTASSVSTPPTPGQQTVTSAASVSGGTTSSTSTVSKALSSPAGGAVPQLGQTAPVPVSRPAQITPQAPAHTMQQSVLPQRLVLTSQAQARLPSGEVVKIAQLASITGSQSRITQPEMPVTLQFQGNKFTLSSSQLRQLTAGQPLQLQGNILQIVSAPGQQILRPQGSVVMQTVSQTQPVQNAVTAPSQQAQTATAPTTTAVQGKAPAVVVRTAVPSTAAGDQTANVKAVAVTGTTTQEASEARNRLVKERLDRVFSANERRCSRSVFYGADLLEVCSVFDKDPVPKPATVSNNSWRWIGRANCLSVQQASASVFHLQEALFTSEQRREALQDMAQRFVCVVPAAIAPAPQLYSANPPPQYSLALKMFRHKFHQEMAPHTKQLRSPTANHLIEFPDLRLLQMDSGKLEALSVLLHKLKSEGRRVLIFTQMVKMLDILEKFLDYHHLTYVRINEKTPAEQRQVMHLRFRVLDADTVVFYDTDLNPSMDAKTQEWCDRIGRSKDIHIYRLGSGNSIEEKLLKNGTKDLIREVAAQGTDYTLAFLTQRTIQDLFEVESGSGEKVEEFVVLHQDPSPAETISPRIARPYIQALNNIGEEGASGAPIKSEDDSAAETSEEDLRVEGDVKYEDEPSRLEELVAVVEQLTPIEKYALHYLEFVHMSNTEEEERKAMEKMVAAKKEWEVQQLKKLKIEDEERMMLEEEEDLFTYTREDAYNMEYVYDGPDGQTEIMPLWTPPTPPQDDNDVYIDSVICLMYDSTPVPESKLPPVYVRKEHKRLKMDPSGRKKKQRHGETVIPPRSLFDKGSFLKPRREGKDQKKNFSLKQQAPFAKPLPSLVKPAVEAGQDNPEWLISEDWALLQAVKQLLELPLNLSIVSAAHTPNWDMVSDVVNSLSRVYRSPKQCRSRYENVIIPREEGKLVYEANPKKKTKSIYKSKNSRPLRTCQIYAQDDSATHIHLYNSRFELMKIIASKRSPPIKPLLGMNPFQKNPKHASVLAESGINYDKPLPPIQVASQRAERIAKEKKALAEQQRAQQLAQQQAGPQPPPPPTPQPQTQQPAQPQAVPQAQAVVQAAGNTVTNTASLQAGTIKTAAVGTSLQTAPVSGNVNVNTVAGVPASSFQPTNKRLASPVIPATLTTTVGASPQVVHTQQRTVSTPTAPAEVVAIATNQGVRTVTPVTASTVSTTLTPVQTQNRSLITQVNPATAPSMQLPPGKGITHAQLHLLRQQQAQVQVQQIQAQAGSPAQIKTVGKPTQTRVAGTQLQAQGQIQSQPAQTAQVTLTKPPVVSVPAVTTLPVTMAGISVAIGQPQKADVTSPQTRVAGTQLQAQGQIQSQPAQTAQVTLTKPPVVSVPAVTTLPVTMAGISVAIGQPQKAGGQVVAHQLQMQHLLNLKKQQAAATAAAQQQKAVQTQVGQGQATVQQKVTVQAQQPTQQKVTYTTTQLQPGIKTQFLTTSIAQAQKPSAAQQVQTQIQVAKLPQIVQQQTVANIQQMVSASQIQGQTQTLSQTTGQQQVQVIPAGTATAQKLLQQQVGLAASPHSPAQGAASSESQGQQQAKKGHVIWCRVGLVTKMAPPGDRNVSVKQKEKQTQKKSVKKELNTKAELVLESRKHANDVFDILEYLQSDKEEEVVCAIRACSRVFSALLERGDLYVGQLPEEEETLAADYSAEDKYKVWMRHRYSSCVQQLLELMGHDEYQVKEAALCTLMKFVEMEGKRSLLKVDWDEHYSFPRELLKSVVEHLLSLEKDMSLLISRFQEYLEFEDIRYYVMASVNENVAKVMQKTKEALLPVYQKNVFALLSNINMPSKESEMTNFQVKQEAKHEEWKAAKLKEHKRAFERMWLGFLKHKLPSSMYKKVLVILHDSILPHMSKPTLMIDFLTAAYDIGGAISLLALNGLFVLIHQHNLDYPDFYKKLYSLLEPSIFHVKYRARFFHLADLFLSSRPLCVPCAEYLKSRTRDSIYNPSEDPYIMEEEDPAKCCALESSLWELQSLQKHYHPNVAKAASVVNKPLCQQEVDINQLLEVSAFELLYTIVLVQCREPKEIELKIELEYL